MGVQQPRESAEIRLSGSPRQRQALVAVDWDALRLPVVAILQPVLDAAQENIRIAQRRHRSVRQKPARGDRIERRLCAAHAEPGLAPAADDLQRLHDELDFPDAAGAELHVGGEVAAPDLLADLAMDVAQAFVHVEIKILAEDERRHERAELIVAGPCQRSRLEPGISFPGATLRDQILLE